MIYTITDWVYSRCFLSLKVVTEWLFLFTVRFFDRLESFRCCGTAAPERVGQIYAYFFYIIPRLPISTHSCMCAPTDLDTIQPTGAQWPHSRLLWPPAQPPQHPQGHKRPHRPLLSPTPHPPPHPTNPATPHITATKPAPWNLWFRGCGRRRR